MGTYNIGQGYVPGSEIELPDGVKVKIQSGTLADGDSFGLPLVHNSDTSNLLSAIGLNSLFVGDNAASVSVDSRFTNDSSQLSVSRNGDPGDGRNAARLFQLRDQPAFENGRTYSQQYSFLQTRNGTEVHQAAADQTVQQQLLDRLNGERAAISGVDQNEELVRMLQFQESFEASVRVIEAIDEMMTELLNAVR